MDGTIATVIMMAAGVALLAVPVMGLAMVALVRRNHQLSQRNAAQAVTIARLERPAGPLDYVDVGNKRGIATGIERVEDAGVAESAYMPAERGPWG